MKFCCISDIHGYLPEVPDCDVLLIGGDIVPTNMHDYLLSASWLQTSFKEWIDNLSQRMKIFAVAGNHDFIFQKAKHLLPNLNWTYLEDSGFIFQDLKIWGSPWQPEFHNWAFNATESELCKKWSLIPEDTDILLLHGPPRGYGDFSLYGNVNTGSPGLLKRIREIKPKLVVAGHIHSGYGKYIIDQNINFINAAYVDENYLPANELIVFDI
jgi:Icc-related predicted phosphoesterase